MLSNAKQRARRLGLPFSVRRKHLTLPSHCPVLGIPLEVGGPSRDNSPSLDRIIPDLGYTPDNTIIVSMRANRAKSDLTVEELRAVASFYSRTPTKARVRHQGNPKLDTPGPDRQG